MRRDFGKLALSASLSRSPSGFAYSVITFDEQASGAGESHGIVHFGFRLVSPGDIDAAVDEVNRAGGKVLRRGEFSPGYPSCAPAGDNT